MVRRWNGRHGPLRDRGFIEVWKKAGFLGSRDRSDDLKIAVGEDGCGKYDGCG